MRGWRKISTVATFEFLATVKRPGYLISTFGMPVFMAAYAGIAAIPIYYADRQSRDAAVYGVVDEAGVLHLASDVAAVSAADIPPEVAKTLEAAGQKRALDRATASSRFIFRPYASEDEARRALAGRAIKGYFVLPPEYLAEGRVVGYSPDEIALPGPDARDVFEALIRQRLVAERLESAMSARILTPITRTQRFAVTRTGEVRDGGAATSIVRLVLPLVFMVLFLVSVLMTSGYLMQGTATEKENKVVEVLLASADPDQILAGKLLGLGGAGLLQIAVWLSMASATIVGIVPLLIAARVDLPWLALALAMPFFALSFLFFGGLIIGTGSLGANVREAQQLALVWSLTAALPMILMMVLLREPNGTLSHVLTWVPFTSGQIIVLRASMDGASLAWWEIAGAFLALIGATWFALRIGARLFRLGLLSVGSRPGLREIVRQARLGG